MNRTKTFIVGLFFLDIGIGISNGPGSMLFWLGAEIIAYWFVRGLID